MPVPPESIEIGKFYLTNDGRLRRVAKFLSDGQVRYAYRSFPADKRKTWRTGRLDLESFAATAVREVPWDWTPEMDETED